MITIQKIERKLNKADGDIIACELRGLSTDTKPTTIQNNGETSKIGNGSTFIEIDTGNIFMYDEASKVWKAI